MSCHVYRNILANAHKLSPHFEKQLADLGKFFGEKVPKWPVKKKAMSKMDKESIKEIMDSEYEYTYSTKARLHGYKDVDDSVYEKKTAAMMRADLNKWLQDNSVVQQQMLPLLQVSVEEI